MRLAKLGGECLGLCRLRACGAVGVERVADDEDFDVVLADEAGDGLEVGAERGAVEGEERLRGEAEGVGDGEADAAVANVEREDAMRRLHVETSVRKTRAEVGGALTRPGSEG